MSDELELDPYGALIEMPPTAQHWPVKALPPIQPMQTHQSAPEVSEGDCHTFTSSESSSFTIATVIGDIPFPPQHEHTSESNMDFLVNRAAQRERKQNAYAQFLRRRRMRQGIALALVTSSAFGIGLFTLLAVRAHNATVPLPAIAIASVPHFPVMHHVLTQSTIPAKLAHERTIQHHQNKPYRYAKHIQHATNAKKKHPSFANIVPQRMVVLANITSVPVSARVSLPKQAPTPHIVEHAPDIIRFDATPEHIYAGQHATICVRTMNAIEAHISGIPQHTRLDPWSLNCMIVAPTKTTTYSVLARNHHSTHIRESLTLVVRPKFSFTFYMSTHPSQHRGN